MDLLVEVTRMGGVGTRGVLVALFGRREVDRALAGGDLVAAGRGRYVLGRVEDARRDAARVGGVVSHLSAALLHGLAVAHPPARPHVTVPRSRRRPDGVRAHFCDLRPEDVELGVTTLPRTVVDCARVLDFPDALAVADSALRGGADRIELLDAVHRLPRTGRSRAERAVRAADPLAANPFESVLRGLALECGLAVRPQVTLRVDGGTARPDLVDDSRRLVLEADSFEWHGGRDALVHDCRRYNAFVGEGWRVLRFAYEHVLHDAEYVRRVLLPYSRGQFGA